MTVDPVALTPPVWVGIFEDNLIGLQAVASQVASTRADLVPTYNSLVADGKALHQTLISTVNGVGQDVTKYNAAIAGLNVKAPQFSAWLTRAFQFSQDFQNPTIVFGVDLYNVMYQAKDAAGEVQSWVTAAQANAQQAIQQLGYQLNTQIIKTVTDPLKAFLGPLANLPWMWIGIGIGAIILLPMILDMVEGDDD